MAADCLAEGIMGRFKETFYKESPVSSLILCETGWKTIGEINIGDKVYDETGCLCNVIDMKDCGVKDVYEVILKDRTSFKTTLDSELRVVSQKQWSNMKLYHDIRFMNKSLQNLQSDFITICQKGFKDNIPHHKYSTMATNSIQFTEQKLPIDPYLLGLLLGDGGFTGSVITFTNPEDDLWEQMEYLVAELDLELHSRSFEHHQQATICQHNSREKNNVLTKELEKLKLKGCDSRQKFIPDIYKYSSIEQRIALLSGIINTDGHVNHRQRIDISTYSKQMFNDLQEIIRSLGLITFATQYDRTNENSTDKYDDEIEYKLTLYCDDYFMFNLSNKHSKKFTHEPIKYPNKIVDIKKIKEEQTVHIILDNKSQMYITNNYIAV